MRTPVRLLVLVSVLAASWSACSKNTTPAAPTPVTQPTQASITLTVSPNPVTALDCSPPCVATSGIGYRFHITGTLTVQETAGVSGNIDSITVTGFATFGADDVIMRSGTNHVAAKGSLSFPLNLIYGRTDDPNATRSRVVPITVAFGDDRGNRLTPVVQWTAN